MKRPATRHLAGSALFVALLAFATTPAAAQTGSLDLNLNRTRIEGLVQRIGEALGRTILLPQDVRGTISIVAKRPVSHEEAWSIMDHSLSMLGYSLLPSTAGTWRVAKIADAVGEAPFRERATGDGVSFVTTLIPLRYAEIENVQKVLEPLAGTRVTLVPYEATNSLIASGSERAIARLTALADELDRVEERSLRQRVLRYRDVTEIEPLLEGYLERENRKQADIELWSDERTNSIMVRGREEDVARVFEFLDRVDRPIEGEGAIRILRVLNRDPEEVADLVRDVASGGGGGRSDGGPRDRAATLLDDADFTIAVDVPSRSLVVRAAPEVHRAIRTLVEEIDVQRELVAVDITISRLSTPSTFGLSTGFVLPFAEGDTIADLTGVVVSRPAPPGFAAIPSLTGRIQRDTGVSFTERGDDGELVTVPIFQEGDLIAGDFEARNDILIQPNLVVTAGDDHEIFVGDDIPIPVSDGTTLDNLAEAEQSGRLSLSALAQTTNFERTEVGTRVEISALAGKRGKIQLDLDIEVSAIDPLVAGSAGDPTVVGPSFVKQTIDVTARLDDGEYAVLAVDDQVREFDVESGVPFFRDIPFFGWLFRTSANQTRDVRLVVAARARRMSNPSALAVDTIRRRLAFERAAARETGRPAVEGPPFGVRVTTRSLESDARAIAESLTLRGHRTRTHEWSYEGRSYFDVYVIGLPSMADAADVAEDLGGEGWETDLVVLERRRS